MAELTREQALALAAARQRVSATATPSEEAARTRTPGAGGANTPEPQSDGFERAGVQALGPVGSGTADSVIKAVLGVKQLFGGLSDLDKEVLKQMKDEREADPSKGWRTTGEVGGNLAMMAVPAAKLDKAVQGLSVLKNATRLRPVISAALSGGALDAATAVGEGDTYAEQMASKGKQGAVSAATGGLLTGALSAISKPFRASHEAKQLMEEGITPTLAQGADSKLGRFVGGMSGNAGEKMVAERQNREVMEAVLRRITPDVDYAGKTTSEMVGIMDDILGREYAQLLQSKTYNLSPQARSKIWDAARKAAGREPDVAATTMRELGDVGNAVRSSNNVRLSPENMGAQRRMLQDAVNAYSGDPAVKSQMVSRGLAAAKDEFDNVVRNPALSPEVGPSALPKLMDLDARYADSRRIMEAAKTPSAQGQMKVADLLRAYRKLDPKGGVGFAKAENDVQREILEPATRLLNLGGQEDTRAGIAAIKRAVAPYAAGGAVLGGSTLGGPLVGVPLGAGYATSLIGQSKKGAEALFGETETQKAMAELLRRGYAAPVAPAIVNMEGE
jgi:hypothetical protein